MSDKSILKGAEIRELFLNGLHMNLTFICSMQYVMDLMPDLRSQVDYVFAFKENNINNRKTVREFLWSFKKAEDFYTVFDHCTQNHECLVIDKTANVDSSNLNESLGYYKANINLPEFKLCKPIFWKLSEKFKIRDDKIVEWYVLHINFLMLYINVLILQILELKL